RCRLYPRAVDGTWGRPGQPAQTSPIAPPRDVTAAPWLVAAATVVAALTLLQLLFVARAGLNLDFEEAQYWLWAQSPAWGYYSKPPMVAWIIGAATQVCGDSEPCVRLASPLLHAATALTLGGVGAAVGGPLLGFWSAVTYATLPGVALSAVLITTDVPL